MIRVENLTVTYPDKTKALEHLSFCVEDGESVALVGANGAGKSTLLLTLVGVLPPAEGTITVDGIEVTKKTLNDIRSRVGMVFQNPDDQLFMPVLADDIAFGPRNFGLPEAEVEAIVSDVLDRLHITGLRDRSPLKLSGGEKRMAAIATVLAMSPSAMLFDEPSAFLDPKARRNLIHLLKGLKQTKLIATHDLALAAELCERVLVLHKGTLLMSGAPRELLFDAKRMDDCGLEAITTI